MGLFNEFTRPKKKENKQRFRPYHHLALYDRVLLTINKGEGLVCTILCVATIEAYINDIEGWYTLVGSNHICLHDNDLPVNNLLNQEEKKLVAKLKEGERLRIEDKLHLFGIWDKSEKVYQDFRNLISIRNGLTHLKQEELYIDPETQDYTGYPNYLNNLIQKKIVVKPKQVMSWIESLENQEYCIWCKEITEQVLYRLNEMLPESNVSRHFVDSVRF